MGKREYFQEPINSLRDAIEGGFHLESITENGDDLAGAFFELTRLLGQRLNINKGVLIIRQELTERLAAVSTWHNGHTREGLTINLPSESSLFNKVAEHGQIYTEDFCGVFSGNFFERKLLLDDESRSFMVHPLKSDGQVVGLLGYSSEEPTAFSVLEEGLLDDVAAKFGKFIEGSFR